MRYLLSILMLACLYCLPVWAAAQDNETERADTTRWQQALERLSEASEKETTPAPPTYLHASFKQSRHLLLLEETLESEGILQQTAGLIRWDTTAPEPSVMVQTADLLSWYYPTQKRAEHIALHDHPLKALSNPHPDWDTLRTHFTLDKLVEDETLQFTLLPKSEDVQDHIASLEIHLSLDPAHLGVIREMVNTHPLGDVTHLHVFDITAADEVPEDAMLELVLPKDIEVSWPAGKPEEKTNGEVKSDE